MTGPPAQSIPPAGSATAIAVAVGAGAWAAFAFHLRSVDQGAAVRLIRQLAGGAVGPKRLRHFRARVTAGARDAPTPCVASQRVGSRLESIDHAGGHRQDQQLDDRNQKE